MKVRKRKITFFHSFNQSLCSKEELKSDRHLIKGFQQRKFDEAEAELTFVARHHAAWVTHC